MAVRPGKMAVRPGKWRYIPGKRGTYMLPTSMQAAAFLPVTSQREPTIVS